jgi:hypothetical protein
MGSFRSQPDLTKHTEVKSCKNFTYASTHMCGKAILTQAGESTWKMLTSASQSSKKHSMPYSQSSMDTAVHSALDRR